MTNPHLPDAHPGANSNARNPAGRTVLDRRVLDELRQYSDDSQDLVQELVTIFLADSPMQLLALQQALQTADWEEVERRSHRLKGSAGSIGAERLRELCQEIEQHARLRDLSHPDMASHAVKQELEALRDELAALQSEQETPR
ncbi:MAG: Hpt domain-containing protein [Bryobacterales bacterium]|jgi:HPt (histidine-containing phosphotransfer) domain-containing protein|nr:Hpt domain-containing protein [Bryobacterales bacterium]